MQLVVHAFSVLDQLHITVSHSDPAGNEPEVLRYLRSADIIIPSEVLSGTAVDQAAFLGECILDMAYDKSL